MHPAERDPSDVPQSPTSPVFHFRGHSRVKSRKDSYLAPRSSAAHEIQDFGAGTISDRWLATETNSHTPPFSIQHSSIQHSSSNLTNNHNQNPHLASPPSPSFTNALYRSPNFNNRDFGSFSQHPHSPPGHYSSPVPPNQPNLRSTLCWGELEPWMDETYAKQVCGLMGWEPVNVRVPPANADSSTSQQTNNPGYCLLTFPSASQAEAVLRQVGKDANTNAAIMPNSNKPFVVNWASNTTLPDNTFSSANPQQLPKEYSIFVGDLAPETSNSDLVAVFRNPVLGLRNDREPKFIRPFLSCKSAKIMLDPVTGVSRGYGFVRFTDETDQQRALVEMHGLYCLSRPMRISPATAKHKPPPPVAGFEFQLPTNTPAGVDSQQQSVTVALPLPGSIQVKNLSTSAAPSLSSTPPSSSTGTSFSLPATNSGSTVSGSGSVPSFSSGSGSTNNSTMKPEDLLNLPNEVLAQIAQRYANESSQPKAGAATVQSITAPLAQPDNQDSNSLVQPKYLISEESWKHHAQARAILGNLIGPNGEQLTSTDPYNTTVFVGGLSPMISEDTLRTFFAPFGDIHYVKVPVGKHCGFVQFVKKADAERAIEKMQGFPIGGSRIRLSWGRSQYKAAQAAAQAAQAAALQAQLQAQMPAAFASLTPEQVLLLLQKCGMLDNATQVSKPDAITNENSLKMVAPSSAAAGAEVKVSQEEQVAPSAYSAFSMTFSGNSALASSILQPRPHTVTSFSPFSPDPNLYPAEGATRRSLPYSELLPHFLKGNAPGFGAPVLPHPEGGASNATSTRPSSGRYLDSVAPPFHVNRAPGRSEVISRPSSSTHSSAPEPDGQEQDALQDLNGTLASLDLDQAWKGRLDGGPSTTDGITTQFKKPATLSHSLSTP